MSIESVAIALHHSRATGSAKLVLIGIANHDGDGGAWPSIDTLAKYAGVAPRNVQMAIKKLEALHEVRRFVQAGGDHRIADHQRPNRYQFLLKCPLDCDRSSSHRTRYQVSSELPIEELSTRVTQASPGDAGVRGGVTQASPKPSLNHPNTTEKKTHVGNRASSGACGHPLIDDRHCERGCAPSQVLKEIA
ncbi:MULTISPECIES: helix-turn-helix domain-containing protein [unclassified Microbacterium]|uniref:helix-turn-helix domain-containing protein n=1 Tax=unclassified Microbacterium TaxID=2609290 RepID=UPI0034673D16